MSEVEIKVGTLLYNKSTVYEVTSLNGFLSFPVGKIVEGPNKGVEGVIITNASTTKPEPKPEPVPEKEVKKDDTSSVSA